MQALIGFFSTLAFNTVRRALLTGGLGALALGGLLVYVSVAGPKNTISAQATIVSVETMCRLEGRRGYKKVSSQVMACGDVENADEEDGVEYSYTEHKYATVTYATATGTQHEARVLARLLGAHATSSGQKVDVVYDPAKPESVLPAGTVFWLHLFGPVALTLGVLLLLVWWKLQGDGSAGARSDAPLRQYSVPAVATRMLAASGPDIRPQPSTGLISSDRLTRALKPQG